MTQWFDMTMRRRVTHHLSVMSRLALMLALGVMTTGCPTDGGGDNTGDEPTGSINNLMSNIRISGEQSLTIVYSAGPSDAEVRGFYVEVASTDANASTIGLEVYFANNLSTGDNRTTSLSTGPMPLGIYRVGLDITSGGQSLRVLSTGTIQITTLPDPEFTLPNQNLTVQPGGNVEIAANVGDAENAVQWRLFFVTKDQRPTADADEYGTQISTGSANVAQATWFTAGAGNGEYEIGIFVTDSGQSIASTVASGNTDAIKGPFFNNFTVTLTDEMSADIPPSVSVTQPSSNQNILVADPTDPNEGNVLVNFSVTVFQGPPALQYVDVFYDFDGQAGTGDEQVISASLPVSATNAVFRVASIDVGTTAFLGVTAHDGVTAPVTRYAPGKIRRASFSDTVLNVTSPPKGTVTEVRPGDGVQIRWQLNAPQATGETTVYVRRLDAMDDPLNSELIAADIVTSGLALSTLSYTYEVESSGRFQATVKVDLDGDSTPLIDSSGIVVATTLPEIVWLGKLASGQTSRQGTVFGGVNFEDNAGSAFAGGEDFDRDGIGDFIIVSRYAKPDSLNPTGVGIGEAYLIRGSTGLANHEFNLNTVSSPQLHGMAFTGIPIVSSTSSDETHGIASAFISTDADNDGVGEIWFGIPFANSAVPNTGDRRIERPGMFVHGGVVCVNSGNDRLLGDDSETGSDTDIAGAVIRLDEVGMTYRSNIIAPNEVSAGNRFGFEYDCGSWLAERFRYYSGECPTGEAQDTAPFVGCVKQASPYWSNADETGGDTLIGPRPGFSPVLAVNYIDSMGTCPNISEVCPSCVVDPTATICNGVCIPWATFSTPGYPVAGVFLPHSTREPLDPLDSTHDYCNGVGVVDGTISNPGGGMESGSEGTVDLPTPDDSTTCEALRNAYGFQIQNDTRSIGQGIMDLDAATVLAYEISMGSGVIDEGWPSMTGFYTWAYTENSATVVNVPEEPTGMRVIGRPPTSGVFTDGILNYDHEEFSLFGTSITQVANLMLVSAPQRDAIEIEGIEFDATDFLPGVNEIEDAGIIYTFDNYAYWREGTLENQTIGRVGDPGDEVVPPRPHMFLAGGGGNNGIDRTYNDNGDVVRDRDTWRMAFGRDDVVVNDPPVVVGGTGEQIDTVTAIGDFNDDNRDDYAVGSPKRNSGDGAVHIVFRRAPALEGDSILDKLALATNDPERLSGVLITGDPGAGEGFGHVVAGGVDFDGDSVGDVIVGVPNAAGGLGEVIIVFSQSGIVTPLGGTSVDTLLAQRQGARITGSLLDPGSEFGFAVANAGDIDQDGKNDLLIAAPSATPRFDPDPSDAVDELTAFGLDLDRNGVQDDVTGPFGSKDGVVDADDDLVHAGLVYVILSSVNAELWNTQTPGIFDINIDEIGTPLLPGFIIVGKSGERLSFAGTFIDGDYLGGGNSSNVAQGGTIDKAPIPGVNADRGRGVGLGAAGDVNGDGYADFLLGAQLADPRVNPQTGEGVRNAGEAYLIFGGP